MAAKQGRTKGKNWDECNPDDTSDDSDNLISRLKKLSHLRRKKKKKDLKSKILSNKSDTEDSSSDMDRKTVKRRRLVSSLPHSISKSSRKCVLDSDDSISDSHNVNRKKARMSKAKVDHKTVITNLNDNDSKQPAPNEKSIVMEKETTNANPSTDSKNLDSKAKSNQHHSDANSSIERKKCKLKTIMKSKLQFNEHFMDDYSIVATPTRSDDESVLVEKKQEILLKHDIIEELEKIKKMTEELKNDLEYHSNYLINKKINVARDSKFIAHKILRIYDLTYEKLKKNRNNFVDIYKSWLDNCSDNTSSEKDKVVKGCRAKSSSESDRDRSVQRQNSDDSKSENGSARSCKEKNKLSESEETDGNKNVHEKNYNINESNNSSPSDFRLSNQSNCQNNNEATNVKDINKSNTLSNDSSNSLSNDSSNSLNSSPQHKKQISKKIDLPQQLSENDLVDHLSDHVDEKIDESAMDGGKDKGVKDRGRNCDAGKYKGSTKDLSESTKPCSVLSSSFSDNQDLFDSSISEVADTPVKSKLLSSKLSLKKILTCSQDKASCVDNPIETSNSEHEENPSLSEQVYIDDLECRALKSLLQDKDSDGTDSEENGHDVSSHNTPFNIRSATIKKLSEDDEELSLPKTNNNLRTKKKLLMQTKKQNSISSDSSSDSAGACIRKKNSRQENDDDLPPRYRRRQAFNVQKNRHYKADKKLKMECRVTLERLSQNVLDNYSSALEKSKNYVANKKFHSITNLDGLESKKKSKRTSTSNNSLLSDDSVINAKAKQKYNSEKNPVVDFMDEDNETDFNVENSDKSNDNDKIIDDENIEEEICKDVENKAREALLQSHSESSNEDSMMEATDIEQENKNNTKANSKAKCISNDDSTIEESDEHKDKDETKAAWKNDELLYFQLTDSESGDEQRVETEVNNKIKNINKENDRSNEEETKNKKDATITPVKKKKSRKLRVFDSDSDTKNYSSDVESNDSEIECDEEKNEEDTKKKKDRKREKSSESDTSSSEKKQKSKRKRIKKVATDSESDDQDSPGKGRKNIRKVLKDKHVADDTKKAAQDEEERLKRIAERQRLFNEMYDARLAGEAKVDKLVLDFDEETKKELVIVDKELVKRLKPHQAKGIKFMWDACFESLKQIEKSDGSGCIIAHCMGLGKTFQVVTLSHTLLSHTETKVRTVMVVCPLSTVLNWVNEFKIWLKHVKNGDEIEIYELTKMKKNIERKYQLQSWQKTGGVLIIGYEMFRNLTSTGKKMRKAMQESIMKSLVDPGADLVVCDEGHLLKNEDSALSKAMKLVKTLRRIVLTGTPLQNNLKEYHCMVQFVKPNLLGSKKEFLNRFVNPITNGQFDDSTPYDVKLMKKRAHVLHKMLEGSVQRFDYSVLTPFLPPKQEYVIFVRLTGVQIKMYQHYLDNFARRYGQRNGSLFADFQELQRIWTHPYVLRLNAEKVERANEKKRFEASDSEGSLKDFIDDESESDSSPSLSSGSGSNSDIQSIHSDTEKPIKLTRSARMNIKAEELDEVVPIQETAEESAWWSKFVEKEHFEDLRISTKLVLLFGILKESEQIGDKVLVFSQSLYSLTLIEQFLNLIDQETQNGVQAEYLDKHSGNWALGLDYFRLDGSTSAENRSAWCKIFNNPSNTRARLFLISTRAGGLGINLTAANRVIIFDASWNPSHDVQSIFRIYRFGQKKPCYVYRFLAAGTMEEKIYNRQVTKLSLACRVVDEQQIERHYSNNDLAELYQFESYEGKSATLSLPKDRLLAEIFLNYKEAVYNYHEHDSLLENKQEEELDEEERKQAWLEYEEEKQGKRQMINMGNNLGFNQMMMNMNSFPELENIKLLIQKDYPNLPPEHLETVARQAVYDMYRYVDQQAVNQTLNPYGAMQGMPASNLFGASTMPQVNQQQQYNPQSQLMNMLNQPQMNYPGVNHMPVYSGRGRPPKHMTMNNPMPNMRSMQPPMQSPMQAPMQAPMQSQMQPPMQPPMHLQQSQQPQRQTATNNDEVEILTNQQVTPPNIESVSNAKNIQKE
ncbi:PREDICTED: transcriptional regulator ATRX homolog [Ceratosolen solmsi marchali]|uniref:Transcriptional regulator ATRX homolog n=1 Tax=Ceratosolen solmsi marchali TaxID=326594 RepID=A0AAJ6YQ11_9HYME|nr:PREDICTED: transcriptional regulator ATRX homolog [Ceratosolen solmsi marchali]